MVCKGKLAAFSYMQKMSQEGLTKKLLRINTHSCEEHKYKYLTVWMRGKNEKGGYAKLKLRVRKLSLPRCCK